MITTRVTITAAPPSERLVRVHIERSEQKPPVFYAAAPKAPEPKGRILSSVDLVTTSFNVDMTAEQCLRITEAAKLNGMATPIYRRVR